MFNSILTLILIFLCFLYIFPFTINKPHNNVVYVLEYCCFLRMAMDSSKTCRNAFEIWILVHLVGNKLVYTLYRLIVCHCHCTSIFALNSSSLTVYFTMCSTLPLLQVPPPTKKWNTWLTQILQAVNLTHWTYLGVGNRIVDISSGK